MRLLSFASIAVIVSSTVLSTIVSTSKPAYATEAPQIDQSSVIIWADNRESYYPKPGQFDGERYSWSPYLDFRVNGPITEGTVFDVSYTIKNKPWLSFSMSSEPQEAGYYYAYDRIGYDVKEHQYSIETGPVSVTITARNELEDLNAVIYKGTFQVNKYNARDPKQFPNFKNKFFYYVDQDWRMPIGYISAHWKDNTQPWLKAEMWFKGDSSTLDASEAHLFYQGKEIMVSNASTRTWSARDTDQHSWTLVNYGFSGSMKYKPVYLYDTSGSDSEAFNMSQNPGTYEVKVLHKGSLSRIMSFTVGADGQITDNGMSAKLGAMGRWTIPVKTVKQTDGAWNLKAWQTQAFYGNPLSGFSVP